MKKFYSKNLARKYYEKIRISELKKQEENIFKEVEKHAVNYMKEFTNSPEFYQIIDVVRNVLLAPPKSYTDGIEKNRKIENIKK